jgi:hypothetical protein
MLFPLLAVIHFHLHVYAFPALLPYLTPVHLPQTTLLSAPFHNLLFEVGLDCSRHVAATKG